MRSTSLGALLFVLTACGAGTPAPSHGEPGATQAASATPTTAAPTPASSGAATATDAGAGADLLGTSTPAGAASSGSPASAAPTSDEPPDTCMGPSAAYEKHVRPALKACYHEAKKKKPDLKGQARLVINVDGVGKVQAPASPDKSDLGDAVIKCLLKALKDDPFKEGDKCRGKSLTIPLQFPSQ
jgi:hypothetical protein